MQSFEASGAAETWFRLPTGVSISSVYESANAASRTATGTLLPPWIETLIQHQPPPLDAELDAALWLLLQDFKPLLTISIPYYSLPVLRWEPVLQWSEHTQVTLNSVRHALRALLTTLSPMYLEQHDGDDTQTQGSHVGLPSPTAPTLACGAVGLDDQAFQIALQQLVGVIMGCPSHWSDAYRFNAREAVLAAGLVTDLAQVVFIEDGIATLLSGLRSTDGRMVVLPQGLPQKHHLHNLDWQGGTLIINAGAALTELVLVNLPSQLQQLTHADFHVRSFDYAGNAIDQDIICQLIYPVWLQQFRQAKQGESSNPELNYTFNSGKQSQAGKFVDGWHWQPSEPESMESELEGSIWHQSGWHDLTLPATGELDLPQRHRLQQWLCSSAFGQELLRAARHFKLALQQSDRFLLTIAEQPLLITRQDLGSQIFLHYLQRLSRALNGLLNQSGILPADVNQVICTGGTASLGAIARWLPHKLPNATITQDTYTHSISPEINCLPTCSRTAYGLATLPLHPQVIDLPRQHCSDYRLLLELLRVFPDQPLSVEAIMKLLEERGIDTQACYQRIVALLEGHLPDGLVPSPQDNRLTSDSLQNPDYQKILSAPLFYRLSSQTYCPNPNQWHHSRRYLESLISSAVASSEVQNLSGVVEA